MTIQERIKVLRQTADIHGRFSGSTNQMLALMYREIADDLENDLQEATNPRSLPVKRGYAACNVSYDYGRVCSRPAGHSGYCGELSERDI